jgi:hypothetical protein
MRHQAWNFDFLIFDRALFVTKLGGLMGMQTDGT